MKRRRGLSEIALGIGLVALVGCECSSDRYSSYRQNDKQLPLSFEWNLGQADPAYQFVARGSGINLFLTAKEAVVDLRDAKGRSAGVIRAQLSGANTSAQPAFGHAPDAMANYFIGADPKKWLTDVPVYSRVRYRNVYAGIDLEYHGENGTFEHDFIVAPGADPSAIRLSFRGADHVGLDQDGNLAISAGSEKLSWRKPVIYQDLREGRTLVPGAYRLGADGTAGFELGLYDRTQPLVIDPVIQYLTYLGRTDLDAVTRVAADAAGNVYLTGVTRDVNFPVTPGAYRAGSAQPLTGNVVVAKLNPAGTGVVYLTHFGGSLVDWGMGIAVDASGNVYLTGGTNSTDFPTTPGALKILFTSQDNPASHCFMTKLNSAGNALLYSTYLGGRGTDRCYAIAIDAAGNAYLTGRTNSPDFPVSQGAFQSSYRGGVTRSVILGSPLNVPDSDAFATKINPTATAIVYSTFIGGLQNDVGSAIAVDAQGNAYVAGVTNSTTFPVTQGALQTNFAGPPAQSELSFGDAFIVKLNPGGTAALYSTYLGGRLNEVAHSLAVDAQGSVYVTGSTASTDFPTTAQVYQTAFKGSGGERRIASGDAFVSKLNPAGSALTFSTYLGGAQDDRATAIAIDATGNAWITGNTLSADFPTTTDAMQRTYAGQPDSDVFRVGDAFVVQLDNAARALRFSTYIGGQGGEAGTGLALQPGDTVFLAGVTSSSNLPATQGVYQRTYSGPSGSNLPVGDGFVARLGEQQNIVAIGGVASAASYVGGSLAPGEIVVLGGTGIGPSTLTTATLTAAGDIATTLAETRILFDDTAAPLIYVSAAQSSAVVPYGVAGKQTTQVVVEYRGTRSAPVAIPVVASKPALFSANASGRGQGAILNQDSSFNSSANPADKDSIIVLFGTGEGQTDPPGVDGRLASTVFPKPVLPVSVTIGSTRITALAYAGAAPGFVAGAMQINVKVPADAPSGDVPVTMTVGSATSQTGLTVAIR